jgi:hypothetical protein
VDDRSHRDPSHTESTTREEAEREVGEARELGREPHHELNNPVGEPDETEWPDPYERRPDPRDPAAVDTPASPADPDAERERDPAPQGPSTSDPHPPRGHDQAREQGIDR